MAKMTDVGSRPTLTDADTEPIKILVKIRPTEASDYSMARPSVRKVAKMKSLVSLILVACLLGLAPVTNAAPGDLDASWGDTGVTKIPVGLYVSNITLQADGSIMAVVEQQSMIPGSGREAFVVRLTSEGLVDPGFATAHFDCPLNNAPCFPRVSVDAQGRVWLASTILNTQTTNELEIRRLLANGTVDTSFATGGTLRIRSADYCSGGICPFALDSALAISTFGDGRAILTSDCAISPPNFVRGTCAISVGNAGEVGWIKTLPGFFQGVPIASIATLPTGSAILAGTAPNGATGTGYPSLLKLSASGDKDASFGDGGVATIQMEHFLNIRQVAIASDGRLVLSVVGDSPATQMYLRTTKSGALDSSWGSNGIVRVPPFVGGAFTINSDFGLTSAGSMSGQAAVLRLRSDGTRETRFGGAGVVTFAFHGGSGGNGVAVRPDGRIAIGGFQNVDLVTIYGGRAGTIPIPVAVPAPKVIQILGGLGTVEHPQLETTAVEYLHRQFNHYFVTANGDEMRDLDLAANAPWERTGKLFKVWYESSANVLPACRFWSDQSFAPRSSHFYTPYVNECAQIRAGIVWSYEGTAFWLKLPDAQGLCQTGTQPLYRAYNDGQGGAPNHRYTVDLKVLDAMVTQGWIAEGDGRTRVFACVPQE